MEDGVGLGCSWETFIEHGVMVAGESIVLFAEKIGPGSPAMAVDALAFGGGLFGLESAGTGLRGAEKVS